MSDTEQNEAVDESQANVEATSEKETRDDEGLGDAGKKALDSERSARKEAEKQFKSANARLAEVEAELEKARAAAEEAEKARAEFERRDLVREVLAEYELPEGSESFLSGADRDELVKKAAELKSILEKNSSPRRPQPVPEAGNGRQAKPSTAQQFAQTVGQLFG